MVAIKTQDMVLIQDLLLGFLVPLIQQQLQVLRIMVKMFIAQYQEVALAHLSHASVAVALQMPTSSPHMVVEMAGL